MKITKGNIEMVAAGGLAATTMLLFFVAPSALAKRYEAAKQKQLNAFNSAAKALGNKGIDLERLGDYVEGGAFPTHNSENGRLEDGYFIGFVPSATTGGYVVFSDMKGRPIKVSPGSPEEKAFYDIVGNYVPRGYRGGGKNTVLFDLTTPHGLNLAPEFRIDPATAAITGDIDALLANMATVNRYGSAEWVESSMSAKSKDAQTAALYAGIATGGGAAVAGALALIRKDKDQGKVSNDTVKSGAGAPPKNIKNVQCRLNRGAATGKRNRGAGGRPQG